MVEVDAKRRHDCAANVKKQSLNLFNLPPEAMMQLAIAVVIKF